MIDGADAPSAYVAAQAANKARVEAMLAKMKAQAGEEEDSDDDADTGDEDLQCLIGLHVPKAEQLVL